MQTSRGTTLIDCLTQSAYSNSR